MPDFGNTTVFSQTDGSNNSGTMPSWSGAAAPSTIDDAGRGLQGAVTREWNWRNYTVTATGTANAKGISYSVSPAAYYNGQRFAFIANTTNTGAVTLGVNSLGAKNLKKVVAGVLTNLASGDMVSGARVEVAYNLASDCFVWVNHAGDVYTTKGNTFTEDQTINGSLFLQSDTTDRPLHVLTHASATANSSASVVINRSRGTYANPTGVANGDSVGSVIWQGYDSLGGVNRNLAEIQAFVDGAPGSGDMPGRLTFWTTPDGSATLSERFRISNTGAWGLSGANYGTSGQVLKSNGSTSAPTWTTIGYTLLGTIATTSLSSKSLSVTLTGYNALRLVFNGVSTTTPGTGSSISVGTAVVTSGLSAGDSLIGIVDIDLATGVTVGLVDNASTAATVKLGLSGYSTATTSVTVSCTGSSSPTFDAGSVLVYGIT